jgi:trehalose-6-phosphate synthase
MHNLHKVGIYKLADLLVLENLLKLKKILISKFDKILFYETPLYTLDKKQKEYYLKVSNPKYWQILHNQKNNINYQNQVKKYELFKKKYCTHTKGILREKIDQKFLELMNQ